MVMSDQRHELNVNASWIFLQVIHTYIEIKIVIDTYDDIGIEIQIECMGVLA